MLNSTNFYKCLDGWTLWSPCRIGNKLFCSPCDPRISGMDALEPFPLFKSVTGLEVPSGERCHNNTTLLHNKPCLHCSHKLYAKLMHLGRGQNAYHCWTPVAQVYNFTAYPQGRKRIQRKGKIWFCKWKSQRALTPLWTEETARVLRVFPDSCGNLRTRGSPLTREGERKEQTQPSDKVGLRACCHVPCVSFTAETLNTQGQIIHQAVIQTPLLSVPAHICTQGETRTQFYKMALTITVYRILFPPANKENPWAIKDN